jgi:hypothetical protein
MTKPATSESLIAAGLPAGERLLLFCIASDTDSLSEGVPIETVTAATVKGLVDRDAGGELKLTDSGRAVLRALIPDR